MEHFISTKAVSAVKSLAGLLLYYFTLKQKFPRAKGSFKNSLETETGWQFFFLKV